MGGGVLGGGMALSAGDFFKDDNGVASMSRLLCFLSFIPATVELCRINNENALGWYLGAYVLGYIGGKASDAMRRDKPE